MPECFSSRFVGTSGTAVSRWILITAFSAGQTLLSNPSFAAENKSTSGNSTQCRTLNLSVQSNKTEVFENKSIARALEKFERSFAENDSELFADVASDSLQKKRDELIKIFDGTVLEYDLQKTRLQRNSIWDLNVGNEPQPGLTLRCGENEIQPVYGPLRQVAVMYSAFTAKQQTRLLVLFASTNLDTKKEGGLGLVLMQVQRWTYDGRTPEKLLAEGAQSAAALDYVVGKILTEAAARVLESNPYLITPAQKLAREQASRLAGQANQLQTVLLKPLQDDPSWTPERFAPVFKDGSLAIGLKIRMKLETALNDQTKKCLTVGRKVFTTNSSWRKSFSGFECMPYDLNEDIGGVPRGGSQYFSWDKLDSK